LPRRLSEFVARTIYGRENCHEWILKGENVLMQ
jgi:hypothetical protein